MEPHSDVATGRQKGTPMNTRRKRALRAAFTLVGTLAATACGAVRYPAHYVLSFEPPSPQATTRERDIGTLAIRELRCPDYLCEGRIVYRPTPAEVGYYQYHRWAVSPGTMMAQHLAERIRAGSLFGSVSNDGSHVATDFVLMGSIERFEEVDEARSVAAVCTISAQLVESRTGRLVWSRTATARVGVEQRDVAGVVNGLTMAARRTVDDLVAGMQLEIARTVARSGTNASER
jgi:ABC-type uncharacterized transport system auxiliary subunit